MFEEWVTKTRTEKGLSQTECAERIGIKQPSWQEYENPTKNRQRDKRTVLKIAEALQVPEKEALQAAGYQSVEGEIPRELETIWQSVPRERQARFLRAVRSMADAVSI